MPRKRRTIVLFFGMAAGTLLARPTRQPAVISSDYHGANPTEFAAQYDQVRLWVRQAQLEVSSRLGLIQYQEGFLCPMTIRFDDGAPAGVESVLAYVALRHGADGFQQQLVINMAAAGQDPMGLQTVFFHEMTHAVMNDAVGGEASLKLPRWLHEGLAEYIGGDGEKRLADVNARYRKSSFDRLGFDVDRPDGRLAYPEFYLGVKYILDKKGINALQALVRDLIAGQSYEQALDDSLDQKPDAFKASVREYALNYFHDHALPDF